MTEKLTIISLAYNVAPYIRESLDSIIKQKTNFKFKILIGDDGSNDGTADILKEYKEKYPDLIDLRLTKRVPRKHKGDYINFANLFMETKTEYFTVLDGDDYWLDEDKLQQQIDFLDNNPDFTICGHNYYLLYPDGKKVPEYIHSENSPMSFACNNIEEMLKGGHCPFMQTSSTVFRNVYKNDDEFKKKFFHHMYAADLIRNLVHIQKGKAKYINKIMSVYRINSGYWSRLSKREKDIYHADFFIFHKKNTFLKNDQRTIDKEIITHCRNIVNKLHFFRYFFKDFKYLIIFLKLKLLRKLKI